MEKFSWLEGKKIQTVGVSNTVKKGRTKGMWELKEQTQNIQRNKYRKCGASYMPKWSQLVL